MSLPFAFCKEAGRVVDIIEARQLFFAQPKDKRRRLNFTCADETCRNVRGSVVTGVNYHKIPGEDRFVQQAHFAARAPHADNCPWIELERLQEVCDRDEVSPKTSNLKQTEIITHFEPAVEVEGDQTVEIVDYGRLREIRGIADERERRRALQDYLHATVNRTSRLYGVTRCYEAMSEDERTLVPLQIDERKRTYAEYFAKVQWCSPEHYWNRVYHGKAHVKSYRSGYSLRFEQWSRAQAGEPCPVSTFVERRKLDAFRGGALLKAVFDEAETRGKGALYCYIYGEVSRKPMNGREVIEVIPRSLHSLAVELLQPEERPVEAGGVAPRAEAGPGLEVPVPMGVPANDARAKVVVSCRTPAQSGLERPGHMLTPPAPDAHRASFGPTPQVLPPLPVSVTGAVGRSAAKTDDAVPSVTETDPSEAYVAIVPEHTSPDTAAGLGGPRAPDTSLPNSQSLLGPRPPVMANLEEADRSRSGPGHASLTAPAGGRRPVMAEENVGTNGGPRVQRQAAGAPQDRPFEAHSPQRRWVDFLRAVKDRFLKPSHRR